jgi:hypothetical protein
VELLLLWINSYGIEMVPTFRHRGYAKWLHRGMAAWRLATVPAADGIMDNGRCS